MAASARNREKPRIMEVFCGRGRWPRQDVPQDPSGPPAPPTRRAPGCNGFSSFPVEAAHGGSKPAKASGIRATSACGPATTTATTSSPASSANTLRIMPGRCEVDHAGKGVKPVSSGCRGDGPLRQETSKNRGSWKFPVGGAGGPDRMYRMPRRGHRLLPQGERQGATVFQASRWERSMAAMLFGARSHADRQNVMSTSAGGCFNAWRHKRS